jgi:hypothetical protein
VLYGRVIIVIMALLSLSLPTENKHGIHHGNNSNNNNNTPRRAADRTNHGTPTTGTCNYWSLSKTTTLTIHRYYIGIILVAIPILSWNWSMHNLWTEMSAVNEFLLATSHQQVNHRLLFLDSLHEKQGQKMHHPVVVRDDAAAAAAFDVQYTELPNGLSYTIKKGRQAATASSTTPAKADRPAYNNAAHQSDARKAHESAKTLHQHNNSSSNSRNIRLRLSRKGGIQIRDDDSKDGNHHHHHNGKNTATTTTTTKTVLAMKTTAEAHEDSQQHQEALEEEDLAILPFDCLLTTTTTDQERRSNDNHNNSNSFQTNVQPPEIIHWTGTDALNDMVGKGFGEMQFCKAMQENAVKRQRKNDSNSITGSPTNHVDDDVPTTLHIEFNCQQAHRRVHGGTGNQIIQFYGTRLAARAYGNVNVNISCTDVMEMETHRDLIVPWTTGYFPAVQISSSTTNRKCAAANITEACVRFMSIPLAYMIHDLRHDLRRMAISLVGLPPPSHPSHDVAKAFAEKYYYHDHHENPPIPAPHRGTMVLPGPRRDAPPLLVPEKIELDDAVIHFRCGDIMSGKNPKYSFVTFDFFASRISPMVQSIGIVTQSFEKTTQSRSADVRNGQRCRIVVHGLVDYLQDSFPNATIHIHNNGNETIALAYTRMIMANQTFAMASTFPVPAALATFGSAYIHVPLYQGSTTAYLLHPRADVLAKNVHLIEDANATYMTTDRVARYWKNDASGASLLAWFRGESIDDGEEAVPATMVIS